MAKRQAARETPEDQVENLINDWAANMNDDEFIEALEVMVDHAKTALDARREELGRDDE
jgi:hypothetical protein